MQWLLAWSARDGLACRDRAVTWPLATWTDDGLVSATASSAMDHAAYASEKEGIHLRFYRLKPSVSLGAHEEIQRVARVEYCRKRKIEIVRRVTGGGALYLDDAQLSWTLLLRPVPRNLAGTNLATTLERLCRVLVTTLRYLDIDATFSAPNDIEVAGRKIACGFVAADEPSIVFQGSLLLDVDIETMLTALRVPTEKLSAQGMHSARQRLTSVKEQLGAKLPIELIQAVFTREFGRSLGVEFAIDDSTPPALANKSHIRSPSVMPNHVPPGAFSAFLNTPGGVLRSTVMLGNASDVMEHVCISGSVQLRPSDLLHRVALGLVGQPVELLEKRLTQILGGIDWELIGASSEDLRYVVQLAVNRRHEHAQIGVDVADANLLMVHSPAHNQGAGEILSTAAAMLVPYCAKPVWCKWRNLDGCSECGLCEVGEAYRLAHERGMRVISINNYEHLCETLMSLRSDGISSYVGMCCENFYVKRHVAFDECGMPAVLMDISGANCYELRQEDQAYAGTFQAQSRLNIELVRKVTTRIPRVRKQDA